MQNRPDTKLNATSSVLKSLGSSSNTAILFHRPRATVRDLIRNLGPSTATNSISFYVLCSTTLLDLMTFECIADFTCYPLFALLQLATEARKGTKARFVADKCIKKR